MLATNPRPLIFFNDTKLVSIHIGLKILPRRGQPKLNISCDPAQAAFYSKILASTSSIQRITHRLYSLQGVTSLLECDSLLHRFTSIQWASLRECFVLCAIMLITCRIVNLGPTLIVA